MNNKLIEKLDNLFSKHKTISEQLEDENIYQDHELLKKLNKEFAKIDPIVNKYNEYKRNQRICYNIITLQATQ